mmetsp:Transcript_4687/g.7089  ORF Transcript_4687/g.7089 Transcript_4687/m.7089 type:complete len:89 (-) Transcript_4687:81-347(-)
MKKIKRGRWGSNDNRLIFFCMNTNILKNHKYSRTTKINCFIGHVMYSSAQWPFLQPCTNNIEQYTLHQISKRGAGKCAPIHPIFQKLQ